MKHCFMIIGIFVFNVSAQTLQPQETCGQPALKIKAIHPEFGSATGFYGIAKGMSDGVHTNPNSKSYENLNKWLFENGTVTLNDVFADLVAGQPGPTIFWKLGFILVFVTLALCIVTAIWLCFYSCAPKKNSSDSKITGIVYAGLLVITFAIALNGLILFNTAESDLVDSIDKTMDYVKQIASDRTKVLTEGAYQVACEFLRTTSHNFAHLNSFVSNYTSTVVDDTESGVGIVDVNDFDLSGYRDQNQITIKSGNALVNRLRNMNTLDMDCKAHAKNLVKEIPVLEKTLPVSAAATRIIKGSMQLQRINSQIKDIKDHIQTESNRALKAIKQAQKIVDGSLKTINTSLIAYQQEVTEALSTLNSGHEHFVASSGYSSLKICVRLLVTLPICIGLVFCIIGCVAIALSLWKNTPSKFTLPTQFPKLATIVLVGFYVSIVVSIVLLLFSSTLFILGWFVSAICVPTFQDDNYTMFHSIHVSINRTNGPLDYLNIGKLFTSCRNPRMTLYSAIEGEKLFRLESVTEKLNLNAFRNMTNEKIMKLPNLTFSFEKHHEISFDKISHGYSTVKKSNLTDCDDEDAVQEYQEYIELLEKSYSLSDQFVDIVKTLSSNALNMTLIARDLNNDYFDSGDWSINESITALRTNLQTNIFMCRPFIDIFNNGGIILCQQLGKPIHGMWASAGLAGIAFLLQSILFLLVYRWLRQSDVDKKDSTAVPSVKSTSDPKVDTESSHASVHPTESVTTVTEGTNYELAKTPKTPAKRASRASFDTLDVVPKW
ncbi:Protein tweety homolog [Caenorhabditis elegans]|uniref:Protein tweety homolog n=1 Tax=Caenorhabditis elegans TaxID=6239 RepID=Q21567_CAEEL|nr:Protein tweety homolog [Caenorhabditis elegans]CAA90126.3 Protein tweety homolog [Caenorhabditis elegans]